MGRYGLPIDSRETRDLQKAIELIKDDITSKRLSAVCDNMFYFVFDMSAQWGAGEGGSVTSAHVAATDHPPPPPRVMFTPGVQQPVTKKWCAPVSPFPRRGVERREPRAKPLERQGRRQDRERGAAGSEGGRREAGRRDQQRAEPPPRSDSVMTA